MSSFFFFVDMTEFADVDVLRLDFAILSICSLYSIKSLRGYILCIMCGGSDVSLLSTIISHKIFFASVVSYILCIVININAVVSKALPIDRPLKTGQLTVLLVYESYYLRSNRWLISLLQIVRFFQPRGHWTPRIERQISCSKLIHT